ncbi:MAG: alpha/beta fold hydrolase [Patescibacteria group bacterium]|nr:alpha/beta fold hydrolase [Patescibacteria group bacterium]
MIFTLTVLIRKLVRDLVIIVVVCSLAITFYVYYTNIHPTTVIDDRNPSHTTLEYENVSFTSTDNVALKGWFIPAKNKVPEKPSPTVIVLHGLGLSKSQSLDWSYFLANDYNLFLFDFRAHGASSGKNTTFGNKETKDVLGAIEYLKRRPDVDITRVAVYGFSMGASAGIMAAAITADIRVIIADSPYAHLSREVENLYSRYWIFQKPLAWLTGLWARFLIQTNPADVAPAESIKLTTAPVLLMAGEDDPAGVADGAREIYANAISEGAELWIVPGTHDTLFMSYRQEFKDRIAAFLKKHL